MDTSYSLYNLTGKKGWILGSYHDRTDKHYSSLLQFGRTDYNDPWKDPSFHYHTISQELYLLIEGELWHMVGGIPILMRGRSLLLVQPSVSHSIVGGKGKIQHYGMKIPHSTDVKVNVQSDDIDSTKMAEIFTEKSVIESELDPSLGYLINLNKKENQNTWLLGLDDPMYRTTVPFHTKELCLAYMNYINEEERKVVQHKDTYHYHKQSTEWYLTIKGSQTIFVNGDEVEVPANHLLKIPKNVPHKLVSYYYPFEGVTMRTPIIHGEKIVMEKN